MENTDAYTEKKDDLFLSSRNFNKNKKRGNRNQRQAKSVSKYNIRGISFQVKLSSRFDKTQRKQKTTGR